MRTKIDYRTASKENYNDFCEKHPNITLSFDEWKYIIYTFNESFREHILETGEKLKLPAGIGEFSIKKRKIPKTKIVDGKEVVNLPIDWKKTREKKKKIYNFNFHTSGYSFGWTWFKRTAIFKHSTLWYFESSRVTGRLINHYLRVSDEYQHKYREWNN